MYFVCSFNKFFKLEIAVVEDSENNYVACLEILNQELVQAKLKYNSPLCNNTTIQNIVLSWCRLNNFKVKTKDVKDKDVKDKDVKDKDVKDKDDVELSYNYCDFFI